MKKILVCILCLITFSSNSALSWSDDNWRGEGVNVKNVYLQRDNHWVQFYGSDGKSYYYYWGTNEEPNERAKMLFSMLLTAFSAQKKVSVAYETIPVNGNH